MNYSASEKSSLIGKKGQEILTSKTVAIAGLGGLGATVAQILVRSGINVRLIDKDRVYDIEMPRLTLYTLEDVKKFKVKQAKKRLEVINKDSKIKTFHEELTKDNLFLLDSDLIIDCTNKLDLASQINEYAISQKIPYIASFYSDHTGYMFVVDKQQTNGACLNCILDKLDQPSTKEDGVYAPITSFIGGLISSAAIKNLLGQENNLSLHVIDINKTEVVHKKVDKLKGCTVCKKAKK
ncbi:MAG: HesA/MoeB/ThiF family protein [Candidatus Nanoarchaeia archaeon]